MSLSPAARDDIQVVRFDYNEHFAATGERPQNFIRDLDADNKYDDYPKLENLVNLQNALNAVRATPAMSLQADLKFFPLAQLGNQFDVILVDPPWFEYCARVGGLATCEDLMPWAYEEIRSLAIEEIAAPISFCFIWCVNRHLEQGMACLRKWGFRRIEDICWVKSNREGKKDEITGVVRNIDNLAFGESDYLIRTKEHCLMGIKGSVRRSTDGYIVHSNVDCDVLLSEEPAEFGSTEKPIDLYELIEHFCMGRRRVELFGRDRNLRNGWLTVGRDLSTTNYDPWLYASWMEGDVAYPTAQTYVGGIHVGTTREIEELRPRSPARQRNVA